MTDAAANPTSEAAPAEAVAAPVAAVEGGAAETAAAAQPVQAEASAAAAGPVRPERLPDEFWDDAAGVKVADLLDAHLTLKAELDAARADVPEAADGYELALSEAVTVPEGFKVDLDADDPFTKEIRDWAHEHKLPKTAWQKLLDAEARRRIGEQQVAVNEFVEDKKALGENADQRIAAVQNWVKANLPTDKAGALLDNIGLRGVAALEAIIALRSDPSAPGGLAAAKASELDNTFGLSRLEAIRRNKAA
ncbi:MAG TPA: hypothetical protein VGN74_05600 [Brevundimonas sp.]|jgi:hypothetical protein|uniref:hypothetical protein n=1 Tax=Brevundimonas sp. TaxID=1871086 RepID=UPI002E15EFCB|nr:hypothetical protein [Brevundimonas sp.]